MGAGAPVLLGDPQTSSRLQPLWLEIFPLPLGQVLSSKAAYFQLHDSTCEPPIAFEIHSLARDGAWGGGGSRVQVGWPQEKACLL